jgi:hypothetical protein
MKRAIMPSLGRSIAIFSVALGAGSIWAASCFDDQNLARLTPTRAEQRPVLIYVWSPRMVYSVQNMAVAARSAAAAGMDFVAVHDSRVPPDELLHPTTMGRKPSVLDSAAEDLATPPFISPADHSRPLCAPALLAREALRHFPTAFVLSSQGIHAQPIVGAMPQAAWQLNITQRLKP